MILRFGDRIVSGLTIAGSFEKCRRQTALNAKSDVAALRQTSQQLPIRCGFNSRTSVIVCDVRAKLDDDWRLELMTYK
jgi:hypothetical protein